jgi:hypothetical protein
MEHIIHSSVLTHLENTNILSDEQHGFRKRRLCDTQLVLTIHDLAKALDSGDQIDDILRKSKVLRPFLVELQMQQDLLMTNFLPVQQSEYSLTRNHESTTECYFVLHNDKVSSIVGCATSRKPR